MAKTATNTDIMKVVKDVQKTVNSMEPRVRSLEDWKNYSDGAASTRKPIVSLDGVDWKAVLTIALTLAAAVYAAIKQVK